MRYQAAVELLAAESAGSERAGRDLTRPRGFNPLQDAIDYRERIPLVRAEVARRYARTLGQLGVSQGAAA